MIDVDNLWIPIRLGAACQINPSKSKFANLPDETPVLFVPMAAVDDVTGEIVAPESRTLGEVKTKSYRTFAPGDVIFAKITPCMENGKSAVVPDIESGIGFGSTEFHVLRPNAGVNPRFIWHYVRQESFRQNAKEQMTGSVGQARVPATYLENYPISLPPETTQNNIVGILDNAKALGGSATAHLSNAYRAIERFRQAVLASACSGRLTAEWRASNRSAVASVPPVESDNIPNTWQLLPLGELAESIRGGSTQVPSNNPSEYPILRSSSVRPFKIDYNDVRFLTADQSQREYYFLHDGDLLITRLSGSIEYVGNCAVVESSGGRRIQYPDRLFCCRLKDPSEARYIEIFFAGPMIRKQIEGASRSAAGHQRISISDLESFTIARPPLAEQLEIRQRVSTMLGLADSLLRRLDAASRQLDRSSQAVLARAFRGELSTTAIEEQDVELAV